MIQTSAALFGISGPKHRLTEHRTLTYTLRHVLAVESESQGEIPLQIVGRLWHEVSPVAQQTRNIVPEAQAFAEHHGFQRVEFHLEFSHDSKVAAPASQSPEKIRIVSRTGVNN